MARVLTGAAADSYLAAMLDAANSGEPVNMRALASDAVRAQRGDRKALTRLKLAHARVRVRPAVLPGAGRTHAPRLHSRGRSCRRNPSGTRCKAPGGHARPSEGVR